MYADWKQLHTVAEPIKQSLLRYAIDTLWDTILLTVVTDGFETSDAKRKFSSRRIDSYGKRC